MAKDISSIVSGRSGSVISEVAALTRLHEVGNRCIRAASDFEGCLEAILDAAIFLTAADKGTLQLIEPDTGALIIGAQRGFGEGFLEFFSHVHEKSAAACGAALRTAQRVVVEDVASSELFAGQGSAGELLAEGMRSVQSTPLISSSERVFGMISTHFAYGTRLREREAHFMDLLARQAADYVERKETERLLTAKRLQLERITGQIDAWIAQCTRDLRYVFVNEPCAAFLGKPVEQIVGHTIPEVIGEAAFQVIRPYVDRVLAGERVEYETDVPYAGAGLRHMHTAYVPDFDAGGRICGWIATISDITVRKRFEQHLLTADRQKDEFLAMLAHELRNPLAPIRYAIATARKSGAPEHQVRAQEVIERQVTHMTRLLDDLLDVSRITRGKLKLQKSPAELSAILADAIEAARPLLDARRHNVSLDLEKVPLRVEADPMRLTQVYANLLINAAKYTDPGGRIELRARRESAEAVVSVRDNGIGIAKELAPRLFTLFTQGSTAVDRSQGGLGVGLALVRGIVELHGGRVEASSDGPNQGSEFTVRLPIAREEDGSPTAPGCGGDIRLADKMTRDWRD